MEAYQQTSTGLATIEEYEHDKIRQIVIDHNYRHNKTSIHELGAYLNIDWPSLSYRSRDEKRIHAVSRFFTRQNSFHPMMNYVTSHVLPFNIAYTQNVNAMYAKITYRSTRI